MSEVFVVRNQLGQYASKHKEWLDGREAKLLFRSPHHDEAINLVFELSSKDIYVRATAISVDLGENKQPIVDVSAPPPEPEETETASQIDDEALDDSAEPTAIENEDAANHLAALN
jgi:hypothetical protein